MLSSASNAHALCYLALAAVTQVAVAQDTEFIVSGSADGHIKFWKKQAKGVEFAKHYKVECNECCIECSCAPLLLHASYI